MKAFAILALLLAVAASGCVDAQQNGEAETNGMEGEGTVAFAMKDLEVQGHEVTSVNVTISSIQVHKSGEANVSANDTNGDVIDDSWTTVFVGSRTIDLLQYSGNVSALIGAEEIGAGSYQQIRLYVEDATITTVDAGTNQNVTADLAIPSNVIKIVRGFTVDANETTLLTIDWDLNESLIVQDNDQFRLRPVMHIEEEHDVDIRARIGANIIDTVGAEADVDIGIL